MTKTPINLQDLRRRMYCKAKSDKTHRFWGIFVHIAKTGTLREAYERAKRNGGAPGIDGQSFADIEKAGLEAFLEDVQKDLLNGNYSPQKNRKVDIPKDNGKIRTLQIPCIRDRIVQGALKLILEAIFEADFCHNSYGFRPKRSPHLALSGVRRSLLRRMNRVIDVDLTKYFDNIQHSILLGQIAKRVEDPKVMHLIKQIIKTAGKIGIPQGGPFSPLAANIYMNEVDWAFDNIRKQTAYKSYEYVNYHRFADDIVITVSGHYTKQGWTERALQRPKEYIEPLGVSLNTEKTKIVDILKNESFGFLGFDFRRVAKTKGNGYFILLTPKKKARKAVKARIKEIIQKGGSKSAQDIIFKINEVLEGWVNYFRVGNSNRAFSEVRDYLEMKIRTLLTRRRRRKKRSVGWQRWSNEYIYGVLKLYWGWKIYPLKSVEAYM